MPVLLAFGPPQPLALVVTLVGLTLYFIDWLSGKFEQGKDATDA